MAHAGRRQQALSLLPVVAGSALFAGLTGVLLWLGLGRSGGVFTYAQDDPYIHMAMARNLAEHGVWGISPHQFAAASSSPLWTLLLAGAWVAGARAAWWPMVFNVLAGVAVLVVADRILQGFLPTRYRVAVLAALVLVTPLPTLALVGMEHTLFIALAAAVAWRAAGHASGDSSSSLLLTCGLTALLVATRYEGGFIAASAAAVLIWRRRPLSRGLAVLLAAGIPVVAFAAFSLAHGGMALPNSILMKSNPARFDTVSGGIVAVLGDWVSLASLFERPSELALAMAVLLGLAATWTRAARQDNRAGALALIFLGTVLLHAALVKLEWFYRYEAYLVVLGVLGLAALAAEAGPTTARWTPPVRVLALLLALPLAARGLGALVKTPLAMENVYEQQYQLGLFFGSAYPNDAVALNDIGAVSWLSSSRVLDVMGLATPEVAELKRHRAFDRDALARLASRQHVTAVAVYRGIFEPVLPRSWTLVGEWTIRHNVAVSGDTVSFLAPTDRDAPRLRSALDAFSNRLPAGVEYVPAEGSAP